MATVTVYNRDGTEYGTLDTSKYVFNNDSVTTISDLIVFNCLYI